MTISPKLKKISVLILLYIGTGLLIASTILWTPRESSSYPLFRLFIITFATIMLTKYCLYMVISPWYDVILLWQQKRRRIANPEPYLPKVSVIIPAWNEEVGLIKTVHTILTSKYPHLEIIVINDGSTDNSDRLMREFLKENEEDNKKYWTGKRTVDIIYQYKENQGKGRALNDAILLSTGEILVSVDADCILLPDTISKFVAHFEDKKVMAAVGNVKIGNQKTLLDTLQYLEFLFSFYFKKTDSLANTIYIIGGAAGAFRRTLFDSVGMYSHKNITEDIDFSVRIQKEGMRIIYAADAIVYTEAASTLKGLSAQRLRWKSGRFQTFLEHKDLFFSDKESHNKLLSWLILPLAVFGDLQLFFEVFFLLFLYIYSFMVHDFSSFISGIIIVSSMFFVQILDDKTVKSSDLPALYLLAPVGWLLFYVTTVVEYRALIKAIWVIITKQDIAWQKWKRVGVPLQKN